MRLEQSMLARMGIKFFLGCGCGIKAFVAGKGVRFNWLYSVWFLPQIIGHDNHCDMKIR